MQTQLPARPTPPGPKPDCVITLFGGGACKDVWQQYNKRVGDYNQALIDWQHQVGELAVQQTTESYKGRIQKLEQEHQASLQTLQQAYKDQMQAYKDQMQIGMAQARTNGEVIGMGWTLSVVCLIWVVWSAVRRIRTNNSLRIQKAVQDALSERAGK